MPLEEALPRLGALAEAAGEMAASPPPSLAGSVAAGADADAERQCDLCWSAPRSVRFACGHALYCEACVPRVLERDTNWAAGGGADDVCSPAALAHRAPGSACRRHGGGRWARGAGRARWAGRGAR